MKDILNPKITMLTTRSSNHIGQVSGIKVGDVIPTTKGGDVTVLAIDSYKEVLVRFNDHNAYEVFANAGAIMKGNVKNPYSPICCGVGYMGVGDFTSKTHPLAYEKWRDMLRRCYDGKQQERFPSYIGCTVADEWHNFQNFAKWCVSHEYYEFAGYHLDKDILVRGNKVYSAENCTLVPAYINTLLTNLVHDEAKTLSGVIYHKNKGLFRAYLRADGITKYLGYFDCEKDAHCSYVKAKEKLVKRRAIEYRYNMEERVFNSLMNWSFYE